MQRDAIAHTAAGRGLSVDDWFADDAARDRFDRPSLGRLRDEARRGHIDCVFVWRLDRLGAGALAMLQIVRELRENCRVCSVRENLDTAGPFGDVLIAFLGAQAEGELDAIRQRTAEARARAERAGKHWGRPPVATELHRRALAEQLQKGLTLRKAAKVAGLSYGSAQRILAAGRQVT